MLESTDFWVLLSFLIFIALAYKPVTRALFGMLDQRSRDIDRQIRDAATLQDEAQKQLADIQRQQRDAARQAEDIISHAKAEAEQIRIDTLAALDETLKRREHMAMAKLAQAEQRAAQEVRNLAVDVAIEAARKVLAEQAGSAPVAGMVDKSISALPTRLQ